MSRKSLRITFYERKKRLLNTKGQKYGSLQIRSREVYEIISDNVKVARMIQKNNWSLFEGTDIQSGKERFRVYGWKGKEEGRMPRYIKLESGESVLCNGEIKRNCLISIYKRKQ